MICEDVKRLTFFLLAKSKISMANLLKGRLSAKRSIRILVSTNMFFITYLQVFLFIICSQLPFFVKIIGKLYHTYYLFQFRRNLLCILIFSSERMEVILHQFG